MQTLLAAAKRRIRLIWTLATIEWIVLPIAVAAAVAALVAWMVGHDLQWWVPAAAVGAAVLVTAVAGRALRISDHEAARVVERRGDLDDVLSSALEFTDLDDPYHRSIQRRAQQASGSVDASQLFPIRIGASRLAAAIVVAALAAGLTTLDPLGTSSAGAEQSTELADAVADLEELAEELEAAAEEVEDEELQAELAELAGLVSELAEDVKHAETVEEAAQTLDRAEQELGERAGDNFLSEKAAVLGLEQNVQLRPLSDGGGSASDQLEALARSLDGLSEAEVGSLADRLDALATSQSEGNRQVASDLRDAADRLRSGDLDAAADALRRAASGQSSARSQVASGEASRAAAAAASRAAADLRGRGEGSGDGDGDGQGNGNGNGQGQGQGSGNGQGSGTGGQAGNGASGQISGVAPSGTDASGRGGVGSPGQGPGVDPTSDVETATVFDPIADGPRQEQQVEIDGGSGEGDLIGTGLGPTARGEALVPYTEVLPSYLSDAAAALDQLQVPPSLRTKVRDYFDNLAEGR